jgi:hypothetical protein
MHAGENNVSDRFFDFWDPCCLLMFESFACLVAFQGAAFSGWVGRTPGMGSGD